VVTWHGLLLVYRQIDVCLPGRGPFRSSIGEDEVAAALENFAAVPGLVERLTAREATLRSEVAMVERPLSSLTSMGAALWWPSPDDTRPELDRLAPPGIRDSVFVLWPQGEGTDRVPSGGWGLAIAAGEWSNGATYATVANADVEVWRAPVRGEVWVHEWLHGVCAHFARLGFELPPGDADGGGRSGYRPVPGRGWTDYYADLMQGRVRVGGRGRRMGIPAEAWRTGTIRTAR
jgi:hypothetical protein